MTVSIRAASPADGATPAALFEHVHGLHVAARPDFFRAAQPDEAAGHVLAYFLPPATA